MLLVSREKNGQHGPPPPPEQNGTPMVQKKSRTAPPGHRPYRLQTYLTQAEGDQVAAFAAAHDITVSLAGRELIRQALAGEAHGPATADDVPAHEHVNARK